MTGQFRKTSVAMAAAAALCVAFVGTTVGAQKMTPADVAAKFTGTWIMNKDLSQVPGGGGGGAARSGGAKPLMAVGFAGVPGAPQRGGGGGGGGQTGGGGSEVSAADRAGAAALLALQGLATNLTIKATADSITFTDARGDRTYPITGKSIKLDVGGGAMLNALAKWDKMMLKQEFFYGETHINQNWELNEAGNRLNFKMQILNMSNTNPPKEAKIVYDKQ
jgi:hypothetical protein